jgi:hypothetical protein
MLSERSSRSARGCSICTSCRWAEYANDFLPRTAATSRALQPQDAQLLRLPTELVVHVADSLLPKDLASLRLVCRAMARKTEKTWRDRHDNNKQVHLFLDADFPLNVGALASHIDARNAARETNLELPRTEF